MESPPLFRLQPALHFGALVGRVIVHDQVHLLIGGEILFGVIQEAGKLAAAMPILAGADHFSVEDVESGEQDSGAVTFVVMRLAFRQSGPQGEDRRGAIQGLNLALLVHAQRRAFFPQNADRSII